MSFEKEEMRLNALWQEIMSDEDEDNSFEPDASSDEYQLSSSEESDESDISLSPKKKRRQTNKIQVDPCTSRGSTTTKVYPSTSRGDATTQSRNRVYLVP